MNPKDINFQQLFDTMIIRPEWQNEVEDTAAKIRVNKETYQKVCDIVNPKMQWYFVGIIHNMEASLDFNTHLHNGDPLTARTVHEPIGRPINPPENGKEYTWLESAVDALRQKNFDKYNDWNIKDILYRIESYNGFGSEKYHDTLSPYLWSATNHYTKGKYEEDGVWNPELVSKQVGAAALLRELING